MKKQFRAAYTELKKMGVPLFEREDHKAKGNFAISAEDAESYQWADYYSEDPDWLFGVNPKLDAALAKHGLFAEWETPGSLNVYVA